MPPVSRIRAIVAHSPAVQIIAGKRHRFFLAGHSAGNATTTVKSVRQRSSVLAALAFVMTIAENLLHVIVDR
jgi:hypothetical protein